MGHPKRMNELSLKVFQQDKAPDRLTGFAIAYLALPYFIFFIGWFKWPFALLFSGVLLAGLVKPMSSAFAHPPGNPILPLPALIIMVGTGIAWSLFGGAGHFFYANFDWIIRDAVLRDLVVSAWPPVYGNPQEGEIILRAPLAYYLPAALAGSVIGLPFADLALYGWTALGTILFITLLPLPTRSLGWLLACLCLLVLFSGMDILGWFSVDPSPLKPGSHLEWWASFFQYSSNSTQLFWVPNHALSAWIAIALFFRHWRNPDFYQLAPIIFALLPLWSPFAAIGMIPFYALWLMVEHQHIQWTASHWLPAAVTLLATAPYLVMGVSAIPATFTSKTDILQLSQFMMLFSLFIAYEFLYLFILVFQKDNWPLLVVTGITLLLLPLLNFGPANDLVMRASIPALMILCIFTMLALRRFTSYSMAKRMLLGLVLSLGAVTPIQEIIRAIREEPWSPQLGENLYEAADHSLPAHYTAPLTSSPLRALFKEPAQPLSE